MRGRLVHPWVGRVGMCVREWVGVCTHGWVGCVCGWVGGCTHGWVGWVCVRVDGGGHFSLISSYFGRVPGSWF